MIVATFSMNSKMVIGLRSNDHLMFFSFIYLSIVCDTNHVHCDLIKIYHKMYLVGTGIHIQHNDNNTYQRDGRTITISSLMQ